MHMLPSTPLHTLRSRSVRPETRLLLTLASPVWTLAGSHNSCSVSIFGRCRTLHAIGETVHPVLKPLETAQDESESFLSHCIIRMRLIFSDSYYKNTDLSDEEGNKLYTISTPRGRKQVTTITKHYKGKRNRAPEELCVIEWHRVKKTQFRFGERVIEADRVLYKRPYSWGRYFNGPDGQTYKWKLGFSYCWLKHETKHAREHLVKFHKRNLGIRKQSHPPFLEVSPEVGHMLDHIIVTYVYMERMRQDVEDEKHNM